MRTLKSIIYVNYSPYENSGKILDFLFENFEKVFLFSLGFHKLGSKKKYNRLLIYINGKLREEKSLGQIPVPQRLFFFLLPLRSLITLVQILIYSFWLKNRYGKINFYFSVNAFTAWIGIVIKGIGLVDKTIFWVWDYYPPIHENKIISLMRYIYWQFDKISSYSDKVVFINQKILELRRTIGVIAPDKEYPIVPIGTENFPYKEKKNPKLIFGFLGVLKKSQGLEIVFDNADMIIKHFPNARLEIIGAGPDEVYLKKRAKNSPIPTRFYGYLEDKTVNAVLGKCSIGIATYIPDKSNVSHYSDPGKVKQYISLGIPVIITNIVRFSEDIERLQAGVRIEYNNSKQFINAIVKIMSNYKHYQKNALVLSKKYYYKNIYKNFFI